MRARGKTLAMIMAALLFISGLVIPEPAFAAPVGNFIKIAQNGGFFAAPGDKEHPVEAVITNSDRQGEHTVTVKLNGKDKDFIVKTKPMTVTLAPGEETKLTFLVDIARMAEQTSHPLVMTITEGDNVVGSANMRVSLNPTNGGYEGLGINYVLDDADGLVAGVVNDLKFELYNRGGIRLKDVSAELSLPDGMTIQNAAATANLGYLDLGDRKTASFPVKVDEGIENTNHPIKLSVKAKVLEEGQWTEASFSDTFYIAAVGGNSGAATKNLTIGQISAPATVETETDFTLSFKVHNNGSFDAEHLKIEAELPSGLLNKTTAAFVENKLAAGVSKEYKITLMATGDGRDTTYPVKVSVSSLEDQASSTVMQYTSIYVKSKGGSGSYKTPRLMVGSYSYGENNYVKTGDEFGLTLVIQNTAAKSLGNIKVTVEGGDTFLPVGSSNAFYVESIESRGQHVKTMQLRVNPAAEQTMATLTINMEYEDNDGSAYTADDTISIPLVQNTRLEIDDVSSPWECYVGMQGSTSVEFYNMGRTTLNNLRITAEGNFDTMESNSYYVGNMNSGSSDSFDFSFIPREAGPMDGKVIFTFEDASGQEHTIEKAFVFEAMEMPVWDDPGMDIPIEEPKAEDPWGLMAGVVVIGGIAAVVILRRRKKKKMHAQLEMEDE